MSRFSSPLHRIPSYGIVCLAFALLCPPLEADDKLPEPYFPGPLFIQLKSEQFNIETIDKIYEMGFRGFRRAFYWEAVDKGDGNYDFSKWDAEFAHAKSKGMRIIGCWFGNNKLYENDNLGGIQTEAGRKAFAKFAAAAAARYKDQGVLWEIWNEPNVRSFWRGNKQPVGGVPTAQHNSKEFAKEYTDLVKEVMKEVLKADPGAFVMAGSVSNYWQPSYEWTEYCFQDGILKTGIRGWSVHPYGVSRPEDFEEGHTITRNLLKKYGAPDLAMIDTERGFSVEKHQGGGEVANEGWSGGPADQALIFQAWHFVRQYMADQMAGVALTSWYELGGTKFGILPDRPIAVASKVMCAELDGYRYVGRLESDSELDYVLVWENKAGEKKLVAWTAPPKKESPDKAKSHDVSISGLSGTVKAVDLAGKDLPASGNPVKVKLTGAPCYITVPSGARPVASKKG